MRTVLYVVLGLVVVAGGTHHASTPAVPAASAAVDTGGGVSPGAVLLLIVGAVVVWGLSRGVRGGGRGGHTQVVRRGRDIEVHTGPVHARTVAKRRKVAGDHEAGHMAVGDARGWKVIGAEVRDDGSGVTRLRIPWLKRYDPRDDIAVSLAGGKAAKTWTGCDSDLGCAAAARDSLPEDQRDAAWREGARRADSALFWRGGQRRRDSQALQREGRL